MLTWRCKPGRFAALKTLAIHRYTLTETLQPISAVRLARIRTILSPFTKEYRVSSSQSRIYQFLWRYAPNCVAGSPQHCQLTISECFKDATECVKETCRCCSRLMCVRKRVGHMESPFTYGPRVQLRASRIEIKRATYSFEYVSVSSVHNIKAM